MAVSRQDLSRIPVSAPTAVKVANTAVRLAVQRAPKKTGKGARGLYPIVRDNGDIGIGIRRWAYYMNFQELGIKPFTMWSLEGKTIPMDINGHLVFRVAKGVGKPGRINKRDPKTGRILPGNVGVRWRHPGLAPKHFIRDSIKDALRLHERDIRMDLRKQVQKRLEAFFYGGDV